MAKSWDIFCRIIDNYGDIGVTWRLARQLASEHGKTVRLWIDDLPGAGKLIRPIDPDIVSQFVEGVEIRQWNDARTAQPADVVIEAFACELPTGYIEKMAAKKPIWINLEYLSAEPWVADFHAQSSPHPGLPLTKHFFFPGFTPETGGLLREHDLLTRRDAFLQSPQTQRTFRNQHGIPEVRALTVSLFCYPHAPLDGLLEAFSNAPRAVLCLVPESGIWPALGNYFDTSLRAGISLNKGNLTLIPLPFLSQDEYDHLLWFCDINFVRGEDSWVRATWAAQPLVWQPYRQQENTHLEKLDAFMSIYCQGLPAAPAEAVKSIHASWCSEAFPEAAWVEYMQYLPALKEHAAGFAAALEKQADLASKLVIFCGNPS